MSADLSELLARTRYLLLDFDGPICAIFAGRPARDVVAELLEVVAAEGVAAPDAVADSRDPFDVLRYAATINPSLAERVEHVLRAAEVEATRTATPTPHSSDVVREWQNAGRALAVVSNNSRPAVLGYLDAHGLDPDAVAARVSADPRKLKPSPYLVTEAIRILSAEPSASTLIGDSITDVVAARRAHVSCIGFANKPGKYDALADAGADVVVNDMHAVLRAAAVTST